MSTTRIASVEAPVGSGGMMSTYMLTGSIGSFAEWYDYGTYAYLATLLALVFFPEDPRTTALLSTFAVFAISFFIRPIGGIIWRHFGDKIGRKQMLSLSILIMSGSTFPIAFLPSYDMSVPSRRRRCCSGWSGDSRLPSNTSGRGASLSNTPRSAGAACS